MTDLPPDRLAAVRAALAQIIASPDQGYAALLSPERMSNLLKDLLPDAPIEKTVLTAAAENGLAETMSNLFSARVPADAAIRMAAESLASRTGLSAGSCYWVSREIAIALGAIPANYEGTPAGPAQQPPAQQWPGQQRPAQPAGQQWPGQQPPGQQPPAQQPAGQQQWPGPAGGQQQWVPGQQASPPPANVRVGAEDATITPGPARQTTPQPPWQQYPPGGGLPPQAPGAAGGSRSRARVMIGVGVAVVVVAAAVLALVLHGKGTPVSAKPSVHIYHLTSGGLAVAVAGSHAWVVRTGPAGLTEIDTATGKTIRDGASGLKQPEDISIGNGYVWVADGAAPGSLVKIDDATGRIVQVLGKSADVSLPYAVHAVGSDVWVGNFGSSVGKNFTGLGSLTELNGTGGSVLRSVQGSTNGITYPASISDSGHYLWVLDAGYKGGLGGVTRIDLRTGSRLTESGSSYPFVRPASIAASGSHVWVLNNPYREPLSLVELNTKGTVLRTLSGPEFDFGSYDAGAGYRQESLAASGDRVWVTNPAGGPSGHGSVTEIDARTGKLIRVLSGSRYDFRSPVAVSVAGDQVWIANLGPANLPGWMTVLKSFR